MKWPNILLVLASLVAFIILTQQGCSDVNLKTNEYMLYKATEIGIDVCTTKSDTIHSNLKFMFIVDRSGSNFLRYNSNNQSNAGNGPHRSSSF
ncbi:MAG: hypothetical protein IPL83_09135 [Bdellovibrionales bacterium]|nr:hypothetical protein [Bdellovibrionales bacterium]